MIDGKLRKRLIIFIGKLLEKLMNSRCHRDTYQIQIGHTHDFGQCILDYYEKEIVS